MKSMFGCMQYQPYGLSQAIPNLPYPYGLTSQTARISRYTHKHSGLAFKVQGLHNAASTTAHSHYCTSLSLINHYVGRNAHTGDQTFKKGIVFDSLALKYGHIFKNGQQKTFSAKRPLKNGQKSQMANPKIVRPTNLKSGMWKRLFRQSLPLPLPHLSLPLPLLPLPTEPGLYQSLGSNRAWTLSHLWTCWQASLSKSAAYDL